jgi:hypothetical protein
VFVKVFRFTVTAQVKIVPDVAAGRFQALVEFDEVTASEFSVTPLTKRLYVKDVGEKRAVALPWITPSRV